MDSTATAHSPEQTQTEDAQPRDSLEYAFGFYVLAIVLGIALALM
jgi:hypothetical protein